MEEQVLIVVPEVEQEVTIFNNDLLFHLTDHNNDLLFIYFNLCFFYGGRGGKLSEYKGIKVKQMSAQKAK